QEDAPVRRREAVDHRDLVDADRNPLAPQRPGQPPRHLGKRRVAQLGGVGVEFLRGPPGRETPEDDGIEKREEDRRQLQHGLNMRWAMRGWKTPLSPS